MNSKNTEISPMANDNEIGDEALKLIEFFNWSALKGTLRIAMVVGMITALATLFIPNEYTSEARLLPVSPKKGGAGGKAGLAMAAAAAIGLSSSGEDSSSSYVDILNSRWVGERVMLGNYCFICLI